jgi:hypothetical protein
VRWHASIHVCGCCCDLAGGSALLLLLLLLLQVSRERVPASWPAADRLAVAAEHPGLLYDLVAAEPALGRALSSRLLQSVLISSEGGAPGTNGSGACVSVTAALPPLEQADELQALLVRVIAAQPSAKLCFYLFLSVHLLLCMYRQNAVIHRPLPVLLRPAPNTPCCCIPLTIPLLCVSLSSLTSTSRVCSHLWTLSEATRHHQR